MKINPQLSNNQQINKQINRGKFIASFVAVMTIPRRVHCGGVPAIKITQARYNIQRPMYRRRRQKSRDKNGVAQFAMRLQTGSRRQSTCSLLMRGKRRDALSFTGAAAAFRHVDQLTNTACVV